MANAILYEHPLNERIRVFLRLEHLFSQVIHFQSGHSLWDSHASVSAFIEILTILERTDVRSEVIKELDRHILGLSKLLDTPSVDRQRLKTTLENLTCQVQKMQQTPLKLGGEIRENDLLNCVRHRTSISGGTCGFDLPAYHYWLSQPSHLKTEKLSRWISEINPIKDGIDLLLSMIRNSAFFEPQNALFGFFQRSFDAQNACQLLRIALPFHSTAYPEVSGSKHRVNIRFLTYTEIGRPKQITEDIEFEISCCAI